MTRDEFIAAHPLERVMVEKGVKLIGSGRKVTALCPFHQDTNPSLSINLDLGLFNCHGCGASGSVIDFLMMKEGKTAGQILGNGNGAASQRFVPAKVSKPVAPVERKEVACYSYQNELGEEVYQVVRYLPKDFRQRHKGADGKWVWSMDGVERVIYHLPAVQDSPRVWIVEGEKDADNLTSLGLVATTNVGGAEKWLDSYSDFLSGKEVVLCGDTDEKGKAHVKLVFESVRNKAKWVKLVNLPTGFKDVSEFIQGLGDKERAKAALCDLENAAHPHIRGVSVPVYHIADIEAQYQRHVSRLDTCALELGKWLPTLGKKVRHLVPGDFMLMLGSTGVGKTSLLTNLALAAQPMPTLLFEFEISSEKTFERTVATRYDRSPVLVETAYKSGDSMGYESLVKAMPAFYLCYETALDPERLEMVINRSELKIGQRPGLVLLDYLGLMSGTGKSRYEKMSEVSEAVKQIAKRTQTIIVAASQIGRKREDESAEVTLCEGKDSGSLENSAGVVLGAWREAKDRSLLWLKVLKNGGDVGATIRCNYNQTTLKITERSQIDDADVPHESNPRYPDS